RENGGDPLEALRDLLGLRLYPHRGVVRERDERVDPPAERLLPVRGQRVSVPRDQRELPVLHSVPERCAGGAEGPGVDSDYRVARGGEVEVREHPAGSPAPTERRGGVELLPRRRDLVAGEPADPGPDRRPVPGELEKKVV